MNYRLVPLMLVLGWLSLTAVIVGASVFLSDGKLIYTLDDPYIHLAVAENILHGGYGVNAEEYSSPSSSILYPLLLAGTELFGLGTWGPLALNLLASGATIFAVGVLLTRYVLPQSGCSAAFALLLGFVIAMCMNSWALPMTGMEHSVHVLAVVTTILGGAELQQSGRVRWWLIAAVICMPLIRFEGLALSFAIIAAWFVLGYRRDAIISLGGILLALGIWMSVMHGLGLPLLPSSVMVKSGVAAHAVDGSGVLRVFLSIGGNVLASFSNRQGAALLLGLSLLVLGTLAAYRRGERQLAVGVGASCTLALLAHLGFGRYGWFARYEVYIVVAMVLTLLLLWRNVLAQQGLRIAVLWSVAVLSGPYAHAAFTTPLASRGIYEQQYQMHRFATQFWGRPIAVNDLGYVSYHNSSFVLDLWGLGSEEVRQLKRRGGLSAASISPLLEKRDVALVMIYENWFVGVVPDTWRRIAVLKAAPVTAASGEVTFFATRDFEALRSSLQRFRATLPPRVTLEMDAHDEPSRSHLPSAAPSSSATESKPAASSTSSNRA